MPQIPVIQVVGYKNAGKTTLVCRLVQALAGQGYRMGTVKHDAHGFDMDHPGRDTWKHSEAGAAVVAITSENAGKTAIIEQRYTPLEELLERMDHLDAVIVEGFKEETYPKIVILRSHDDLGLLQRVRNVVAVASRIPDWSGWETDGKPVYHIDDIKSLLAVLPIDHP